MPNELSVNLACVSMRNGVEVWVERERANALVGLLTGKEPPQFISFDGRLMNRADIVGVFTAQDMEDMKRRKNGQWSCRGGKWHDRNDKCACVLAEWRRWRDGMDAAIKDCGKCQDGTVYDADRCHPCACLDEYRAKNPEPKQYD